MSESSAMPIEKCAFCGDCSLPIHPISECPAVEEIEYFADGRIKRIKKRWAIESRPVYSYSTRVLDCVAVNGCKVTSR